MNLDQQIMFSEKQNFTEKCYFESDDDIFVRKNRQREIYVKDSSTK
jgi:hypothetical protein